LPDGKTLYIQYNEVHDQPGGEPIARFFPRLFAEAEQRKVERVVLDLRFNGGGNNELNRPIWHAIIRNDRINQPGKLWVIIGPKTFSAAMNCVDDLELNTHAVFAGEPTGETPNMWGDPAPVTLPNSGIVIQASTLWWQLQDPRDTRNFRGPDLAAELTFADFANNIDPVMKAVEQAGNMKSLPDQLRELAEAGQVDRIGAAARSYLNDPRFRWASFENPINMLGYQLMGAGKLQAAIEVLKVNTERYPQSWNSWDSLAEALMKAGDTDAAVRDYRKSLELNPRNTGAREAIAKMQQTK
jgi:tetratricopeptide (TPR) repeat protein